MHRGTGIRDAARATLNPYTCAAFRLLPGISSPCILDIGCGTGAATLCLAELSDGEITGIDIDEAALRVLRRRIRERGLSGRVRARKASLEHIPFEPEDIDIMWAEGSINVVGFASGIELWAPYLKHGGFLVIHDDLANRRAKLEAVWEAGYELCGFFALPEDAWADYYDGLERALEQATDDLAGTEHATSGAETPKGADISSIRAEIARFRESPLSFRSGFYILSRP